MPHSRTITRSAFSNKLCHSFSVSVYHVVRLCMNMCVCVSSYFKWNVCVVVVVGWFWRSAKKLRLDMNFHDQENHVAFGEVKWIAVVLQLWQISTERTSNRRGKNVPLNGFIKLLKIKIRLEWQFSRLSRTESVFFFFINIFVCQAFDISNN